MQLSHTGAIFSTAICVKNVQRIILFSVFPPKNFYWEITN